MRELGGSRRLALGRVPALVDEIGEVEGADGPRDRRAIQGQTPVLIVTCLMDV